MPTRRGGIFYIREVNPKFVTEPQSTDTIIGEKATVTWEVNFKPVRIEIYRRIEAMQSPTFSIFSIQDTDCQKVEDNIIQHTETWGDYSEYFVRAFYADAPTAFVDSEIIRVTVEQEPDTLLGDVTGDGMVNMLDVMALYNGVSGKTTLTDAQTTAGDMDANGALNMLDVIALYNKVSGK